MEVLYYYDTNADMTISLDDDIDVEHYELMIDACDTDNDGNLDACEIHTCI